MRKRPLLISVILFFIGVLLAHFNVAHLLILSFIALLCLSRHIKGSTKRLLLLALVVISLGAGRMSLEKLHKDKIVSHYGGDCRVMSLVITEPTKEGKALAHLYEDKSVEVYLSVKNRTELFCGDIVTGEITLSIPSKETLGTSSFVNHLASQGVYLQASADGVRITGKFEKGIMGKIYSLRRYMDSLGAGLFRENNRALFNAMIFGDKSLISDQLHASLQGSGLNHIAVVSGMHLSVAIAFIMLFIRKIFGNRRIGFLIAILISIFITLLSGGGASVVRALLMCSLFYLSNILYRENDSLTSLFNAIWIMMLVNPYIIFNMGLVLSALSVLGLILFGKKFSLFLKRFLPEMVANAMALTLAAQLMLTPVIVYYFGVITPYAPLSNIVAVPLSSIYVITGLVLTLLSPIKPLASVLAPVMKFLATGIERLCEEISSLPYALIDFKGDFAVFALAWIFLVFMVYFYPMPIKKAVRNTAILAFAIILVSFIGYKNFATITFTPCGGRTITQVQTKDGSFLVDCPDVYELIFSDTPYENIVFTGGDIEEFLATQRMIKRIYLPEDAYEEEIREEIFFKALNDDTHVYFKKDGESFPMYGTAARYIEIDGIENARALELNIRNKRIITLQGLSSMDIKNMVEERIVLSCDYLYVPQEIRGKEKLSSGGIISNNKFLLKR